MASARERLSANMAALSYALEQAGGTALEGAPFEVRVASGRRPGPLERRRQDPNIATPDEMGLELEQGKPLKNLGRILANSAGIPLPYNFRQSAEAAEQARLDYENQNTMVGDMADTFLEQMDENALHAADDAETRIYNQYKARGQDAIASFFAQDASPEQRAAAAARLSELDKEARAVQTADSNERTKFVRQYIGGELATSRAGLVSLDMAEKDRVMSFESELAQLDNVQAGSTEEQIVLRALLATGIQRSQDGAAALLKAGGGAIQMAGNPVAVAAGAAAQVAGALIANETAKLDRDTVVRMRLEMNDAMDAMTEQFRPEIVRLHEGVADEAKSYGIPSSSWSSERIKLDTPYADSQRSRLFGDGGSNTPSEPVRQEAPDNTADYLRRRADRIDARNGGRRPTR